MSVRVLVIPEDPFNNGYILKPLVDAVLADVGKPLAETQILINPRLRGYDHAGYRLHPLKGKLKGRWSISVSGNWRLTFEFKDGDVDLLDYEDYH